MIKWAHIFKRLCWSLGPWASEPWGETERDVLYMRGRRNTDQSAHLYGKTHRVPYLDLQWHLSFFAEALRYHPSALLWVPAVFSSVVLEFKCLQKQLRATLYGPGLHLCRHWKIETAQCKNTALQEMSWTQEKTVSIRSKSIISISILITYKYYWCINVEAAF